MPGLRSGSMVAVALVAAFVGGCAGVSGTRSSAFVTPELSDAYIPLYAGTIIGSSRFAAAFVVAPNIAVTNDHNLNLLAEDTVIARSQAYDLLFFRTERTRVPLLASPKVGQAVIAYGQDGKNGRREAKGVVRQLDARAIAICGGCPERPTITYDAEAGEGFSGGPVVDAATGAVIGITVGYLDGAAEDGGRRMYAMDMDFVLREMRRLIPNGNARSGG
jgi:S1-C subfamily serine protease